VILSAVVETSRSRSESVERYSHGDILVECATQSSAFRWMLCPCRVVPFACPTCTRRVSETRARLRVLLSLCTRRRVVAGTSRWLDPLHTTDSPYHSPPRNNPVPISRNAHPRSVYRTLRDLSPPSADRDDARETSTCAAPGKQPTFWQRPAFALAPRVPRKRSFPPRRRDYRPNRLIEISTRNVRNRAISAVSPLSLAGLSLIRDSTILAHERARTMPSDASFTVAAPYATSARYFRDDVKSTSPKRWIPRSPRGSRDAVNFIVRASFRLISHHCGGIFSIPPLILFPVNLSFREIAFERDTASRAWLRVQNQLSTSRQCSRDHDLT